MSAFGLSTNLYRTGTYRLPLRHSSLRLYSCIILQRKRLDSSTFLARRPISSSSSTAPKICLDIKDIRLNPELHRQNCLDRNNPVAAEAPQRILDLHVQWRDCQVEGKGLRARVRALQAELKDPVPVLSGRPGGGTMNEKTQQNYQRELIIKEAQALKKQTTTIEEKEANIIQYIEALAATLPNLTSLETPRGNISKLIEYINSAPSLPSPSPSHVDIGTSLRILDFTSAGTVSGWGWYYLLDSACLLEQALITYAQSIALKRGWRPVTPPSMVYTHIASACGFQPRDTHGEQQIYKIAQQADDVGRKPEYCLTGTAEIPLAGINAKKTMKEEELPCKRIAVSRCYRAEAGARGVDTKGLYRVHEFSKVEMLGWSLPSLSAASELFEEMLDIQKEILAGLELHCRILEMPTADLGASAMRKVDVEAYFPSRSSKDGGWGEVTSLSICADYQTRRLGTRVSLRELEGKLTWPWTVNGTALAVPRVLAAILENGWDEVREEVRIPKVLWGWMNGMQVIRRWGEVVDKGAEE